MSQDNTNASQGISEKVYSFIVRFFFGMLLAISLYLSSLVAYCVILNVLELERTWVPIIFQIDLCFIIFCCIFGAWQWQRLPKQWWIIAIDAMLSGLIIIGLIKLSGGSF